MKGLGHQVARSLRRSLLTVGVAWVTLACGFAASTAISAAASSGVTPVTQASTSARGVTAHSVNVEFPVVHDNHPPSARCRLPLGHLPPQGVRWHVVPTWKILPKAG